MALATVTPSWAYTLQLPQDPRGPGIARATLRTVLQVHGMRDLIETAELLAGELVTNACKYAPGPCLLDLVFDGDVVEITVWDTDSTLPVPRAAEPGRIGQHGMEIVIALCEGYDVRREPVGKRIKVRLAASDDGRA